MVKEIKIRPLTVADRKKLSNLILKVSEDFKNVDYTGLISSRISPASSESDNDNKEAETNSYMKLGVKILQTILSTLEEETHEWFADLISVTKEEFLVMPLDTEVEIIDQIVNSREATSFFTKALHLYNETKKYLDKQG